MGLVAFDVAEAFGEVEACDDFKQRASSLEEKLSEVLVVPRPLPSAMLSVTEVEARLT